MAEKSSRDGASGLGWFVIGLLIGAAGTLATQKFAVFKSNSAVPDAAAAAIQPPAPAAAPKLLVHQGGLSASSANPVSATPTPNTTGQTAADVADDAAATGMTARAKPQQPPAN
jgi:hypothetical protein